MDQHAEAVAVSREDAGAFDVDRFGEIVEAHCTPDAVEFDEEAPECIHFGCTNRVSWWSPNQERYNRVCDYCRDDQREMGRRQAEREQKDAAQVASLRAELGGGA